MCGATRPGVFELPALNAALRQSDSFAHWNPFLANPGIASKDGFASVPEKDTAPKKAASDHRSAFEERIRDLEIATCTAKRSRLPLRLQTRFLNHGSFPAIQANPLRLQPFRKPDLDDGLAGDIIQFGRSTFTRRSFLSAVAPFIRFDHSEWNPH